MFELQEEEIGMFLDFRARAGGREWKADSRNAMLSDRTAGLA